jgi:glycosyltransferase involved in cell wall biosynthesis
MRGIRRNPGVNPAHRDDMRIGIIGDAIDAQSGGIHVYTSELVRALGALGGSQEYILVRERRAPPIPGIRQVVIPNLRAGMVFAAFRLLVVVPLVLRWYRVDAVVESAHFGPFNLPRRIRRVTVIHDLTPVLFPHQHQYVSQRLQRLFLRRVLLRADLILSNSNHTTTDIRRYEPRVADRIKTIHLGTPRGLGQVAASPVKLGGRPYWLSVGTIEPRKNLVRLLDAYRCFREETGAMVMLVIVGQRGWKSAPFFEALSQHPYRSDIHLPGYVSREELAALYSHSLGLLYVSTYEGFGLPVLEAFSYGCPVICSEVASLPEVGGPVARYVDPMDPASIAGAMTELYREPAGVTSALKQAAKARAAAFSWERYARELVTALRE